jgi:hypothetical protein
VSERELGGACSAHKDSRPAAIERPLPGEGAGGRRLSASCNLPPIITAIIPRPWVESLPWAGSGLAQGATETLLKAHKEGIIARCYYTTAGDHHAHVRF